MIEKKNLDVAVVSIEPSPLLQSAQLPHQCLSAPINEAPNKEMQEFEDIGAASVMAVETRAQKKRREEQERKDEEATTQSGVVLTPVNRTATGLPTNSDIGESEKGDMAERETSDSSESAFQIPYSANQSPARKTQISPLPAELDSTEEGEHLNYTQEADQTFQISREELI